MAEVLVVVAVVVVVVCCGLYICVRSGIEIEIDFS